MSRMGGRKAFDLEWVERWARQVNEDRRLPVIGRFFSGNFVLGIDDTDYLIEVNKGKVQKIAEGLAPNDFGFEFALRASSVTWGKFALHRHLRIDGNAMPFWQNLRALTHMLSLMRKA